MAYTTFYSIALNDDLTSSALVFESTRAFFGNVLRGAAKRTLPALNVHSRYLLNAADTVLGYYVLGDDSVSCSVRHHGGHRRTPMVSQPHSHTQPNF